MNNSAPAAKAAPSVKGGARFWDYIKPVLDVLVAMAIGFLIGAVLLLIWGYDPLRAYTALIQGSFGSTRMIGNTLASATPLILTGLTFAIGVRAGLFIIGAQGQMFFGPVAVLSLSLVDMPAFIHLPLGILAAMAGGALWALIPALLKVTRGVHEVISTIMFNWIGRWLTPFLFTQYLIAPLASYRTISTAETMRFSQMIRLSELTTGIFVAVGVAVFVYWLLWHSPRGFELRMAGLNPDATRYSGAKPKVSVVTAFLLGGATAGLGGAMQVMAKRSSSYAMDTGLTGFGNLGFDGIAVALVGRNHPLGVIFGGIFFGALASGAREMQRSAEVPLDMIMVVQGTIILAMAVPELHRMVMRWRRKRT